MRTQSIFFVVIGLLGACFSFLGLVGASVPLEEPTKAALEHQSLSINLWWLAIVGTITLFGLGVRGLWKSRR